MPFEISPKIVEAPAPVRRALLSDLIRDGAAKHPEGFWYGTEREEQCCAIGAAARSVGWMYGHPIDYLAGLGYDESVLYDVSGNHGTRFRDRQKGRNDEQGDIRLRIADELAARGL